MTQAAPRHERFTMLARLAVGGMAEVLLAQDRDTQTEVVCKRIRPDLLHNELLLDLFRMEAKIGAQLHHPHVVEVFDYAADPTPTIVMEHLRGQELSEVCARAIEHGVFLPRAVALELMRQALDALAYVHHALGPEGPLGVVHCDISPTNLFVTDTGRMVLIDFGIAQSRLESRGHAIWPGKLSYMSPEQLARRPLDGRSDLFSLGVVLWEITLERRLFRGPAGEVALRLAAADVPHPSDIDPSYPRGLADVVMKMLARDPEDRFADASAARDALAGAAADAGLACDETAVAAYLASIARSDETGGAPRADDWAEVPQSDAEVARAVGVGTGELQKLRTPVPGMSRGTPATSVVSPKPTHGVRIPQRLTTAVDESDRNHEVATPAAASSAVGAAAEWFFVALLGGLLLLVLYVLIQIS